MNRGSILGFHARLHREYLQLRRRRATRDHLGWCDLQFHRPNDRRANRGRRVHPRCRPMGGSHRRRRPAARLGSPRSASAGSRSESRESIRRVDEKSARRFPFWTRAEVRKRSGALTATGWRPVSPNRRFGFLLVGERRRRREFRSMMRAKNGPAQRCLANLSANPAKKDSAPPAR